MKQLSKLIGIAVMLLLVFSLSSVYAQDAINPGDIVTGTLTADSGGVPYVISLSVGDIISVALDSDAFDAVVYIHDAAGTELLSEDYGGEGNNAVANFFAPANGDYTILARGWSSSAEGDYTLTVTGVVADELAYDSSLDVSMDNEVSHYFKFKGAEGDVLHIFVDSGEQDLDMELALYNLSGEVIAENSDGGAGVDPALVRVMLPASGLYIVEMTSWFDEPATGVLTVTSETAELLQLDDGALTLSIGERFEYDVVRFTGVTNGLYRISMVSPSNTITANATIDIDGWTEINLHIEGALQGTMDFYSPRDGWVDIVVEPGFWSEGMTVEIGIDALD